MYEYKELKKFLFTTKLLDKCFDNYFTEEHPHPQ